jgi:hypothetical protein
MRPQIQTLLATKKKGGREGGRENIKTLNFLCGTGGLEFELRV